MEARLGLDNWYLAVPQRFFSSVLASFTPFTVRVCCDELLAACQPHQRLSYRGGSRDSKEDIEKLDHVGPFSQTFTDSFQVIQEFQHLTSYERMIMLLIKHS